MVEKKIYPSSWDWETHKSSKIIYIDDITTNIPLKAAVIVSSLMVDWNKLNNQFKENGLYD